MLEHLDTILRFAVKNGVSDVHLKVGRPPVFRRNGALSTQPGTAEFQEHHLGKMVGVLLAAEKHRRQMEERNECDLAYEVDGIGRFRVSVYRQSGQYAIAIRVLGGAVPGFADLHLPSVLERICQEQRGLVLVTGTTGSGKSTTLASMLDHINATRRGHILTIEDPIEFALPDRQCIVSQREVGFDTPSFAAAMRGALRMDPDVILIGEMRDLETIESALVAAETGHLVMSTVHTLDAPETINRIVMAFPPYHQERVRLHLASILRAVVSLRLMPRKDGKGRVPACEVLVANEHVRDILKDDARLSELRDVMARSFTTYGMQTFDQSVMMGYTKGWISYEEALRQASNPQDFALRVSGIAGADGVDWDTFILSEAKAADKGGNGDGRGEGISRF